MFIRSGTRVRVMNLDDDFDPLKALDYVLVRDVVFTEGEELFTPRSPLAGAAPERQQIWLRLGMLGVESEGWVIIAPLSLVEPLKESDHERA